VIVHRIVRVRQSLLSAVNVQSFNVQQEDSSRTLQKRETRSTTKDMLLLIARSEKSSGFGGICDKVNQWHSTSREALNGSLAPQTLRLARLHQNATFQKVQEISQTFPTAGVLGDPY